MSKNVVILNFQGRRCSVELTTTCSPSHLFQGHLQSYGQGSCSLIRKIKIQEVRTQARTDTL